MKLNKFLYLYSKPLGNHTLKITKKLPGNLLKNLEKSWKYHGILSVQKSGNPVIVMGLVSRFFFSPNAKNCLFFPLKLKGPYVLLPRSAKIKFKEH